MHLDIVGSIQASLWLFAIVTSLSLIARQLKRIADALEKRDEN